MSSKMPSTVRTIGYKQGGHFLLLLSYAMELLIILIYSSSPIHPTQDCIKFYFLDALKRKALGESSLDTQSTFSSCISVPVLHAFRIIIHVCVKTYKKKQYFNYGDYQKSEIKSRIIRGSSKQSPSLYYYNS